MTTRKKSPLSLRLMKYRRAAGFNSPAQLAEAIGNPLVTKSKIVNLEQGRKSDITITEACLVARALGIPVLALVCDIDKPFGEPDLVGFDGWRNADLFALFTVPDGSYGPVSEACADSYEPNIDLDVKRDYLQIVYTWVRYLAGGIAGFNESIQKLFIKQLEPVKSNEIDELRAHCIVYQYDISSAFTGFKHLNIEIPEDVRQYANKALGKKIPRNQHVIERLKKYEERGAYFFDDGTTDETTTDR